MGAKENHGTPKPCCVAERGLDFVKENHSKFYNRDANSYNRDFEACFFKNSTAKNRNKVCPVLGGLDLEHCWLGVGHFDIVAFKMFNDTFDHDYFGDG